MIVGLKKPLGDIISGAMEAIDTSFLTNVAPPSALQLECCLSQLVGGFALPVACKAIEANLQARERERERERVAGREKNILLVFYGDN
jgi:hypothetical protein